MILIIMGPVSTPMSLKQIFGVQIKINFHFYTPPVLNYPQVLNHIISFTPLLSSLLTQPISFLCQSLHGCMLHPKKSPHYLSEEAELFAGPPFLFSVYFLFCQSASSKNSPREIFLGKFF